MAQKRKKSNRRYRRGRIYFCGQCGNYSWLAGYNHTVEVPNSYRIIEDGKRPEGAKPIGRTCPRCRVNLA